MLFGIKYSYPIQIISKQIYLTHRWDPNKYYHSRPTGSYGPVPGTEEFTDRISA